MRIWEFENFPIESGCMGIGWREINAIRRHCDWSFDEVNTKRSNLPIKRATDRVVISTKENPKAQRS